MSTPVGSKDFLSRLEQAARHFPISPAQAQGLASRGAGVLLSRLANIARDTHGTELTWLLAVTVTGFFPTPTEFRKIHRRLRSSEPALAHRAFLEAAVRNPIGLGLLPLDFEIVTDAVVADVDFCAKFSHNTGIQRVVRQTMARWARNHEVLPIAWTDHNEAMRSLSATELGRVVNYGAPEVASDGHPTRLVVPFRSTVLILEVPWKELCAPLEALAEFSGNRVGVLGYDAIPVVSADTVPEPETERFVKYLSIVKHSDAVAGISAAATSEFAGFADAVTAQGLAGPRTMSVPLPVDIPDTLATLERPATDIPAVLCVGSQEPRKNHGAVLYAAEVLWREGHKFSLRFVGGGSLWFTRRFDKQVARLAKAGFPIEVLRGVNDDVLLQSYSRAAFTVFPSLHEGYGLPVAESLALGVPVITSNYGSTAEIAADGGCLVVDPRNDDELVDAMRRMLVEPGLLDELRAGISARPSRTWDDYADELWRELVQPLATVGGEHGQQ